MTSSAAESLWNERSESLRNPKKKTRHNPVKQHPHYIAPGSDGKKHHIPPPSPAFTLEPKSDFHESVIKYGRELEPPLPSEPRFQEDHSHDLVPRVVDQGKYHNYLSKRFSATPSTDYNPNSSNRKTKRTVSRGSVNGTSAAKSTTINAASTPSSEHHPWKPQANSKLPVRNQPNKGSLSENVFRYNYFIENEGFAVQFTQDFIYRSLDDEIIPDLLIDVISEAAREDLRGPSPRELYSTFTKQQFFARDFINAFVYRAVEDEFVPDLLIEAIEEEAKYQARQPEYIPIMGLSMDFMHELIREVVPKEVKHAVKEAVDEESHKHLESVGFAEIITSYLINDILQDFVSEVVKETVRQKGEEEISAAIAFDTMHMLFDELMLEDGPKFVNNWLAESVFDHVAEDSAINDVVEEEARIIATQLLTYYGDKLRRRDLKELLILTKGKTLSAMSLDYLISLGIGQFSVFGTERAFHKTLEGETLNVLLNQSSDIYTSSKDTLDNYPLARFHEKITSDVATDVLVNELLDHINGDLCDLDMEEVKDPRVKQYVTGIDPIFYARTNDS